MCGNALLAPFVKGWAQVMCPGMHCSDITGKPEHLDRGPAHHMEVEGNVNNGASWSLRPQRIPTVLGELEWLLYLLYAAPLLFVV